MKIALRAGIAAFLLFAIPSAAHANVSSLVWGGIPGGPEHITMLDGGTYTVPLNTPAPAFVTGPLINPEGEFVIFAVGNLYRMNGSKREYIATINQHAFDDPDDPNDGDALFVWPSAGSYELDIVELPTPQPFFIFENQLMHWLAKLVLGETAYAQVEGRVLDTIHFTIEDSAASEPDPVIIIPGILGSEQHNGVWVIDPILHTYDDLIATLDANGYTPGVDLFTFPYNWRKSNVESALLLKQKIDEVKGMCGCAKVDLVAHSMGGLVARQYVQSSAYVGDVDQLIFLGTPHLGAPKAYLMWEGGELAPVNDFFDELTEKLLEHEAYEKRYPTLFAYIRTEPIESVRELLPVYDYIFDEISLRSYPTNYPRNVFLENLNNNLSRLLNSGVEIHNIIGETSVQETINAIQATDPTEYLPLWAHGYPEGFYNIFGDHGLIRGFGDKTVPLPSASFVNVNVTSTSSIHSALPSTAEGGVFRILTGHEAGTLIHDHFGLNIKLVLIKILSPADLLVVAPDGSKIGKDLATGLEVNEIPNAFYTGFTTNAEFVTILNPLPGQYKVFSQGTGSGSYTVETNFISEATTTEASFTGNTAPGLISEINLGLSTTTQITLKAVVTFESTLADLDRIYALGWINIGIYRSLKEQLKAIKKAPPAIAKRMLRAMLNQLKQYRGKLIDEQGYQILKADIEWLINN